MLTLMIRRRMNDMRYEKIVMVTVACVIVLCFQAAAQDFKEAIGKMRQDYAKLEKLHVVMTIKAFEDSLSTQPFYSERADVKKDGKNYAYHFGNIQMLMNMKYLIVVDQNAHEIVVSRRDVKSEENFLGKDPLKMNMDSLFNLNSEPHYLGKINAVQRYKITQKKGPIKQVDMQIRTSDNVLHSIAYLYKDGQYVKITFEVFEKQPEFKANTFDESVYITRAKGKLSASQNYIRYNVLEVKN